MKCPKCQNAILYRPPESPVCDIDRLPYSCPNCGGMWLTNDELTTIGTLSTFFESYTIPCETTEDLDKKTGLCPAGHGVLDHIEIDDTSPFHLERCPICCGIWFDHGEWNRIANSRLFQHLTEFLTLAVRRRKKATNSHDEFIMTQRKLFGPEIFTQLMKLVGLLKDQPFRVEALAFLHEEVMCPTSPRPDSDQT